MKKNLAEALSIIVRADRVFDKLREMPMVKLEDWKQAKAIRQNAVSLLQKGSSR